MKIEEMDKDRITVLITGCGGAGSLGREIMKAFEMSHHPYKIIATNSSPLSVGLFETSHSYLIPQANSSKYIQILLEICKNDKVQILVPGTEQELEIITRNSTLFYKNNITVLSNPLRVIEICSDKYRLMKFLLSKGLSCPKTYLYDESDLEAINSFPVIIKPNLGSGSRNVYLAQDIDELVFFCKYIKKYGSEPIIQEYIPNIENEFTVGILYVDKGKLSTSVAMKRILRGSVSTRQVMISPNSNEKFVISSGISQGLFDEFMEVREYALKIAELIGADGPVNIQCRKIGDEITVFEINPRFSGTVGARSLVGHNEPDILTRYKLFSEIPNANNYRYGYVMKDFKEKFILESQISNLQNYV